MKIFAQIACSLLVILAEQLIVGPAAAAENFDHSHFDAAIDAPFKGTDGDREIVLDFEHPGSRSSVDAIWRVEVVTQNGIVIAEKRGRARLTDGHARITTTWNEEDSRGHKVPPGFYTIRMLATPSIHGGSLDQNAMVHAASMHPARDRFEIEQSDEILVGRVAKPSLPKFRPLKVGAQARISIGQRNQPSWRSRFFSRHAAHKLPYTIYYGNLHAQSNHSDGGADVAACGGAEQPQAGDYGPLEAYEMMRQEADGDFLLISEHNHMYDGSARTDALVDVTSAVELFESGLQIAEDYRSKHSDFMALYGLEWGIIEGGGHVNLINPDALATWEADSTQDVVHTPRSDYASLYAVMRQRGWIGQFNHPAKDQFVANDEALGYDENGAEVMVLAEVLNSSAFSTNVTEDDDKPRKSFVSAWNQLLERGYRLAPSSNQDNHCSNWGLSFTNRTGVLLPDDQELDEANFLDALRARRTFATEDKSGQLVLVANEHVMGEEFVNAGKLTLKAYFASATGRTVQRVQFFEGVPGRNGQVSKLDSKNGTYVFTPEVGEHFYYAVVTQDDGLRLWSAPVWVIQE